MTDSTLLSRLGRGWRDVVLVRHLVYVVIAFAVVIVLLSSVDDFQSTRLTEVAYLATAAGGLTLLTGLNGQISLGHGALMAFGAYTTARLLDERETGIPLLVVVLASVAVTVVVGLLIGVAAARLHGPYLAGATLTLAVAVPELGKFFKTQLGGEQGLRTFVPEAPQWGKDICFYLTGADPTPRKYVAFLAFSTLIITFSLLANLASSRVGRRWAAVRDDDVAAELAGINLTTARVSAFAVSAAAAGAAGSMFALAQRTVAPGGFGLELSLELLAIVVLGGLGSLAGALVLTAILVYLPSIVMSLTSEADPTRSSQLATLAFGLVMVLVILLAPRGLAGVWRGLGARLRARRAGALPTEDTTPDTTDTTTAASTRDHQLDPTSPPGETGTAPPPGREHP